MRTAFLQNIDFLEVIDERHMTFLTSSTAQEAVETLVQLLQETGAISNPDQVLQAIYHREKIVSTGIGLGIAVPHARLDNIDQFFVAVGIQKDGPISWVSVDNVPVRIVFLVIGPQNQDAIYLKVLSKLTEIIRTPEIRNKLLHISKISDLVQLFESCYSDPI
jgi:PTS system nitrogen regulatory IIA component